MQRPLSRIRSDTSSNLLMINFCFQIIYYLIKLYLKKIKIFIGHAGLSYLSSCCILGNSAEGKIFYSFILFCYVCCRYTDSFIATVSEGLQCSRMNKIIIKCNVCLVLGPEPSRLVPGCQS